MAQTEENQSTLDYIRQTARTFLDRETTGGLLLIAATLLALIIGNSDWATPYHHLLEDEFIFKLTDHFTFGLTVEKWINDGLMFIFFLVAGLEIKREIMVGELSSFQKAFMPFLAALGGMVFPALIFYSFNAGTDSVHGWGIPMATDIAYSLGIIGLLGNRVPVQLKVLLVALAIADDLGAILVIAIFYSSDISWLYLGLGGAVFILLFALNLGGVKKLFWFSLGGVVLWYFFLNSGVHPTIAGVLLALTIPIRARMDSKLMKERTAQHIEALEKTDVEKLNPIEDLEQRKILKAIRKDSAYSHPPLLKMENALSGFNAFFIIPVFALANAGVKLDISITGVLSGSLGLGIVLGLGLGKVMGISLFSFVGQKIGVSKLHRSIRWRHIFGMGMIAGIGFTMSLFITKLAFTDTDMIKISKISILFASMISAIIGLIILFFTKPKKLPELQEF